MEIHSSAFRNGESIPSQFTCDGKDISPQILWSNIPPGTKSLVLICDDPDAPAGTWVHWVVLNIPVNLFGLKENIPPIPLSPDGMIQAKNSWGNTGYGGPCPPGGIHRYFFKLYALDFILQLDSDSICSDVQTAIKGHIIDKAEMMGKYSRKHTVKQ
jgi:Raf kinase inhibitor-like YbhB/YbcL family protein